MGRPFECAAGLDKLFLDLAKRSKIIILHFMIDIALHVLNEAPQPSHPAAHRARHFRQPLRPQDNQGY
ncbi:MAG: hypothetical protein M0Z84_00815 [Gammaproteobacteria bacterium]|nr:hypothetical protein [Gammaproteobacteria bacterium]